MKKIETTKIQEIEQQGKTKLWYQLEAKDTLIELKTDEKGLSQNEAQIRLSTYAAYKRFSE